MTFSRRRFIKSSGAVIGAVSLYPAFGSAALAAAANQNRDNLADAALATAKRLGASYADIRINRYRNENVATRERQVINVSSSENYGFGVRVLVNGSWGFAASPLVTPDEVERITREAVAIAKANSTITRRRVELVPVDKATAKWKSSFERDPFDVPASEKTALLLKINEAALGVKGVSFVTSNLSAVNEQKYLATTDGCRIEQYIIRTNPSFSVTAVDRASGDFQSVNSLRQAQQIGFEYMSKHDWAGEATTAAEHAVMKLTAKPVEPGKYDLVLHPSHLFLTIHESVGHSTELDRALLYEANYAGTSFLTPDKAGKLQFGSKMVNFVADRTQPLGMATVAFDDEGVPGQEWHLVRDGIFVDWQTTRDMAKLIGKNKSNGCLHGDSWDAVPFPRMPNVSLQPAKEHVSQDDLIAGVDRGILIYGRGSYSIDQQRYNFQFGGQTFWEIKGGKVVGMLKDVAYQSKTTDFWGALDGLGGLATYEVPGSPNDGKGEPGQSNSVSHGCPPARFRQINVLNTAANQNS
jgi:TldD protein